MKKLTTLLMLSLLAMFASCASNVKDEVREDRMSLGHGSKEQMIEKMRDMLAKVPGITTEQTEKMLVLHSDVYVKSQEISEKILQNKVLLFKYLAEGKKKEMEFVKKETKKLYLQKLDLMFGAFDQVEKILGKDTHKILIQDDFKIYHGFSRERW